MNNLLATQLKTGLDNLGFDSSKEQIAQLLNLLELLIEVNQQVNLTRIIEPKDIINLHFLDSLSIKKWMDQLPKGALVIDAGSGPGFPGLPLALFYPHLRFQCIEARNKKVNFINQAIELLHLKNIKATHSRLETMNHLKPKLIVSRALCQCQQMIDWTKKYTPCPMLMMKGQYPAEELAKISIPYKVEDVNLPGTDIKRHIVVLKSNLLKKLGKLG